MPVNSDCIRNLSIKSFHNYKLPLLIDLILSLLVSVKVVILYTHLRYVLFWMDACRQCEHMACCCSGEAMRLGLLSEELQETE